MFVILTPSSHTIGSHEALDQALAASRKQKESRNQAVAETAGRLIMGFSKLLNPKSQQQESGMQA